MVANDPTGTQYRDEKDPLTKPRFCSTHQCCICNFIKSDRSFPLSLSLVITGNVKSDVDFLLEFPNLLLWCVHKMMIEQRSRACDICLE